MSAHRRLGIEFYGDASGFIGAANRVMYGTSRISQGLRTAGRDAGYMSNQMKAVGTTLRYYFAGQFIFGIMGAVGNLREFKNELGVIGALASQLDDSGKLKGLGGQLQDLGSNALLVSNQFGVAVGDIEAYMQRFYSAFELPKGKEFQAKNMAAAKQWAEDIAGLQVTLGKEAGDPDVLGGGIAGFINQIPGGTKDIPGSTKRVASMIAYLTSLTPNITGRNIADQIGRVGSTMTSSGMTPEQTFSIWTAAGKSGGSSAIIARGIAQMVGSSLLHPQSPAQKAAYMSAIGTSDPSQLRSMGSFEVLKKLLDAVSAGNPGKLKDPLSFNTEEDLNKALLESGLNSGGLTKLYDLFGRTETVRQFINILGVGGSKALDSFVTGLNQAEDANLQGQRVEESMRQRGLATFQQSMVNLNLSLVRGMEFPLETFGKAIKFLSNETIKHRTTATVVTSAAATLYATRLLGKFGAFNALNRKVGLAEELAGGASGMSRQMKFAKGFLRVAQGASAVERSAIEGALMTEAGPNVVAGGAVDGTRGNPFWVIIHPYSNYVGVQGGAGGPLGGGGTPLPPIVPVGSPKGIRGLWNRIPKGLRGGLKGGGIFGTAAILGHELGLDDFIGPKLMPDDWHGKKGYRPFFDDISKPFDAIHRAGRSALGGGGGSALMDLIDRNKAAQQWNGSKQAVAIHGKFDPLHVKATIVDKKGNLLGTAEGQAPVKLWGPSNFPTSQGKAGTRGGT